MPPKSFVNSTVIEARDNLAEAYIENQYYVQKFHELVDTYPVPWNTASNNYQTSQSLYQQAQNNIDIIVNPQDPEQGALGCFDIPYKCIEIAQNIMSNLQSITQDDLNYLAQIKYYYPEPGGNWVIVYPNGDTDNDWATFNGNPGACTAQGVQYCTITPDYYAINYGVYCSNLGDTRWYRYNGTSTDNGANYQGTLHYDGGSWTDYEVMIRNDNPFYFTAYNASSGIEVIGDIEDSNIEA